MGQEYVVNVNYNSKRKFDNANFEQEVTVTKEAWEELLHDLKHHKDLKGLPKQPIEDKVLYLDVWAAETILPALQRGLRRTPGMNVCIVSEG